MISVVVFRVTYFFLLVGRTIEASQYLSLVIALIYH